MTVNDSVPTPDSVFSHVYQCYCERQIIASMLGIAAVTGIFGNSLVLLSVGLSRKLRTVTNAFVFNLSAADLLTCLSLPLYIVAILSNDGYLLPHSICVLNAFVSVICIGASVNTLACIAINRLILITKSRAVYQKVYKQRHIALMIAMIWGFPGCIVLIPIVSPFADFGYEVKYSVCLWVSNPGYALVVASTFYPLQLAITIYSYVVVFLHVQRSSRAIAASANVPSVSAGVSAPVPKNTAWGRKPISTNPASVHLQSGPGGSSNNSVQNAGGGIQQKISSRRIEVTKNLFYVVCAFLVCISPYILSLMISNTQEFVPYAAAILTINSCLNPIIYATKHPDFKKTFRAILCCKVGDIPEPIAAMRSMNSVGS